MNWTLCFMVALPIVLATLRYDGIYLMYGSGDTIISVFHAHGGSKSHARKWVMECMDGEAMTGIQDWIDDFEKLTAVSCRFTFPHKPAAQGIYPYYPRCHVRDYTTQFFCFDAQNASVTLNTFITGLWDSDFQFYVFRTLSGSTDPFMGDATQPYKCCQTPDGYYIDYVSCYYRSTHDIYFEYYDSQFHLLVQCGTGFVMTGISKKQNPFTRDVHLDWIQCCRVGYGPPAAQSPPIYNGLAGIPASSGSAVPVTVPSTYIRGSRYRMLEDESEKDCIATPGNTTTRSHCPVTNWDLRYKKHPIPNNFPLQPGQGQPLLGGFHPRDFASFGGKPAFN
ncbi:hypothetical protein BV898_10828 [Hypsibius exemplaris]|uniref:Uncharacterized protein n=1 Tax=Hypsibius exemplaris TaxID=2072580 RepID=A0A1W0WIC6_HYPEX|nr:hypothetical protein BV898_10828 [Hypsibius exemplaris]